MGNIITARILEFGEGHSAYITSRRTIIIENKEGEVCYIEKEDWPDLVKFIAEELANG